MARRHRRRGGRRIRRSRRAAGGFFDRLRGRDGAKHPVLKAFERPLSRVVAPIFGFMAAASPFVTPAYGPLDAGPLTPLEVAAAFMPGGSQYQEGSPGANVAGGVRCTLQQLGASTLASLPEVITFGVSAALLRWGGKKVGL